MRKTLPSQIICVSVYVCLDVIDEVLDSSWKEKEINNV